MRDLAHRPPELTAAHRTSKLSGLGSMHPRSRARCRDPPSGGGRHRRRSPPPRRPPPPPPRRYEEIPAPVPDPGAAGRRSRADILLEAGRLAAHYLVARGVIPDHLLRAREDPNHATFSRPEPPAPLPPAPAPAPADYGRRRDDDDEDPRSRRRGDWGRAKDDGDRQSRRLGWDRRSHGFDERRKYDGARRTRDYDEPKRSPMSRSYSHNDRRASVDGRLDPKRRSRSRSRSRSRTRARSYHDGGSRRDSDGRPANRDLDHPRLPDSGVNPADGEMPRKPKVPSSVLVAELNDSTDQPTAIEDGEMESGMVGLDHAQDVSEEEDGEFAEDVPEEEDGAFAEDVSEEEDGAFAATGFDGQDGAEMDVTGRPLSDVDVHMSESVEEPVHMQSHLRNVDEEIDAGAAPMDASMAYPSADKDSFTEVGDEMEAPQSEAEAGVGNLDRDEQELPAWYRFFDLNVVETPEGCEMPEISGDSPAGLVCNSVPNLAGQMNQQTDFASSELQGQDEHAGANHRLEYGYDLSKYDLNNMTNEHAQDDTSNLQGQDGDAGDSHLLEDGHDLNKCDLSHEADTHAHDSHLLSNEEIRLNCGMAENDSDSCCMGNEQMLRRQNADEQDHDDHQIDTEQMLVHQGTSEPGLDTYHVSDKQFVPSHVTDEQVVNKHQLEPEPMNLPMDVHDVDTYKLNHEQMLLNSCTNKHAEVDTCQMKDGETLLYQAVDGQAGVHNMANGRTVPVIVLEGDYVQQPDTRDTGKFLESISDQEASSFPDNPHANIQAVSSSSVTPNFGNRCTGRGDVNSQVIPGGDDALYGAFDKMPSEVINVWELPSSELGKSS